MVSTTLGVLGTAITNQISQIWIRTAAELADKWPIRIALEWFMVLPIWVVHATVGYERSERRVFLATMDAEERAVLVPFEEDVPSVRHGVLWTAVAEKALRV